MTEKANQSVLIVCYSGTGCALLLADTLAAAFAQAGRTARVLRLIAGEPEDIPDHGLLVLVYAVHAMNAPEPMHCCLARFVAIP